MIPRDSHKKSQSLSLDVSLHRSVSPSPKSTFFNESKLEEATQIMSRILPSCNHSITHEDASSALWALFSQSFLFLISVALSLKQGRINTWHKLNKPKNESITDGRTDTPSYRVASSRQKIHFRFHLGFPLPHP